MSGTITRRTALGLMAALPCAAGVLSGCDTDSGTGTGTQTGADAGTQATTAVTSTSERPVLTMNAPYRNTSHFYELMQEKYPEVNLQITPYNGQNYTTYVLDMRAAGQMPDIYFTTYYTPGRNDDAADFLDVSSYDFTGNYAQSRLREVTNEGAVYMLPLGYNALGITYNKTLLDDNGWELPTSLADIAQLKEAVEAAGYTFCRDQLQYPGYGFQYITNVLSTGFLSTVEGIKWQNAFITGETTVKDTPEMVEAFQLLDRWKELGLLNAEGTPDDDAATKDTMRAGNVLFLVGNSNTLNNTGEGSTSCEFRLMPYLSDDGSQNVFILNVSRYVGLNKSLGEAGNEQKLEDALKVMDVLSTVEGMESLDPSQNSSRMLPLKNAPVSEDSYYANVLEELNSGHTANFIYAGWENYIAPAGEEAIAYIKDEVDLDGLMEFFDDNQHLLTDNDVEYYTTATETIEMDDCARAVGICFAQATDAAAALVSTNPWIYNLDAYEMNKGGVSGKLFALPIGDSEIVSILPTGWRNNIQTVTLAGKRVKELAEQGYDYLGDGSLMFPYVLVTEGGAELDDDTTYTVAICGVSDAVAEEGDLQDSGVMGLDAAREYFSQFETLSTKDIVWE